MRYFVYKTTCIPTQKYYIGVHSERRASDGYIGCGKLLERLTAQVGSREMAIGILQKRGHLKADGKTYTKEGMKRNAMTAEERAKDRASKYTGRPAKDFKYNPKTNTVRNERRLLY